MGEPRFDFGDGRFGKLVFSQMECKGVPYVRHLRDQQLVLDVQLGDSIRSTDMVKASRDESTVRWGDAFSLPLNNSASERVFFTLSDHHRLRKDQTIALGRLNLPHLVPNEPQMVNVDMDGCTLSLCLRWVPSDVGWSRVA
eukprot:NODE_1292_length_1599_cov_31.898710_g1157_i0.p1 GENE.NODE_1292_length_1599_cov_31.898710_g1157_i0~~NODE_1292_length_1599_cov_31.898710_g1157_i0.p1  ORF type:complete len:141 (+),score=19.51 NODE_1292_length_1599_cov_31.898710_g1157_i0:527-949(+)